MLFMLNLRGSAQLIRESCYTHDNFSAKQQPGFYGNILDTYELDNQKSDVLSLDKHNSL